MVAGLDKSIPTPQAQRNTADLLTQSFPLIDTDGNHLISVEELTLFLTSNKSLKVTDRGNGEIFTNADIDEDGQINYKEFVTFYIHAVFGNHIPLSNGRLSD